jgi:putative transposase
MKIVEKEGPVFGVSRTCDALGISRATYYRRQQAPEKPAGTTRKSPRALSEDEEKKVLAHLAGERFADKSVAEAYHTLLDEGTYLCSRRTMSRVLKRHKAVKERRNQLRHPEYQKPELLARRANELWSWDITKLKGPRKWSYYYLYVILDVFSRYVAGWMIASRESATLAKRLIRETCQRHGITRNQLTVHADRGSAMQSKGVAQLLADLGITKTHSRPHVSNDNPYSEAQFKTLKYHCAFPGRFGSPEDARYFLRPFFDWYNNEHRHAGIGWLTPASVHAGKAEEVLEKRSRILAEAYERHPERFVKGLPRPAELPGEVWINKPNGSLAA